MQSHTGGNWQLANAGCPRQSTPRPPTSKCGRRKSPSVPKATGVWTHSRPRHLLCNIRVTWIVHSSTKRKKQAAAQDGALAHPGKLVLRNYAKVLYGSDHILKGATMGNNQEEPDQATTGMGHATQRKPASNSRYNFGPTDRAGGTIAR